MKYYNLLDAIEVASNFPLSVSPVMQDENGYDYWYLIYQ